MKNLIFILMLLLSVPAMAYQTLPAIQIKNLNEFAGSYLSVFYVSGSKGAMGIDLPGQKPKVNMILPIIKRGATEIEDQEFPVW